MRAIRVRMRVGVRARRWGGRLGKAAAHICIYICTRIACLRDLGVFIDVDLDEDHIGVLLGHLREERRDALARAAPG